MRKILSVALFLAFCSISVYSQSATEISMAKSMARSYGYSDDEIDKVLNHDIQGNVTPQAVVEPQTAVPNQPLSGDIEKGVEKPIVIEPVDNQAEMIDIFGHEFFISKGLSLIPSITAPVPESYIIGPGDQVLVDIWGNASLSLDLQVAGNGSVNIPKLGPVYISGKTIAAAQKYLSSKMSSLYSGLSDGSVSLSVSVGKIRGVSVYVLGAVMTPGVYTLPSLCSAATAIFLSGGIKKSGSVRNIFIFRGGKKVATFDLYDFIFHGKYDTNLRLQDGDIISVSTSENIVSISGPVRTPMRFELKESETLNDLIEYAGGFEISARTESVHIDRSISKVATSFDVDSSKFLSFKLYDGDDVSVARRTILFDNKVTIEGNVLYPGKYSITENVCTVKDLISVAGGVLEGTYMRRASIQRLDNNRLPAQISFVPQDVLDGKCEIALKRDDIIRIYSQAELSDKTTVSISGYVNTPGVFEFREGMTIGDLLLLANGIADGADLAHVEIASKGRESSAQISSLNLTSDETLLSSVLQPYDIVYIRNKENYRDIKSIEVRGEVKYPGLYAVEKNSVRISDIFKRVNGFTDDAYIKGIKMKRRYTDEEIVKAKLGKLVNAQRFKDAAIRDSIIRSDSLAFGEYFYVSLNVPDALKHPGSSDDVILRDGDVIEVPQMNNTVKISGAVYLPNTVSYNSKLSWKDYIDMAGGFSKNARRSEVFAIYQDGSTAARGSSKFKMEPGMQLFVPNKDDTQRRQTSGAEIAAIASAITSITSMVILLINNLNR